MKSVFGQTFFFATVAIRTNLPSVSVYVPCERTQCCVRKAMNYLRSSLVRSASRCIMSSLQGTMATPNQYLALIGQSPAIETVREEVEYAARCDAKVLVTGESGVGKEIVARLIHAGSERRNNSLVTVNCAALTESLLETELFGHVRGSFTGAHRDRTGVLEQAHRGTIFMDEIGETTPRMQGLLLRFLETGEIQRVGSDRTEARVNVRVIAATNRNLVDAVAAKTFREDLYYRLNV